MFLQFGRNKTRNFVMGIAALSTPDIEETIDRLKDDQLEAFRRDRIEEILLKKEKNEKVRRRLEKRVLSSQKKLDKIFAGEKTSAHANPDNLSKEEMVRFVRFEALKQARSSLKTIGVDKSVEHLEESFRELDANAKMVMDNTPSIEAAIRRLCSAILVTYSKMVDDPVALSLSEVQLMSLIMREEEQQIASDDLQNILGRFLLKSTSVTLRTTKHEDDLLEYAQEAAKKLVASRDQEEMVEFLDDRLKRCVILRDIIAEAVKDEAIDLDADAQARYIELIDEVCVLKGGTTTGQSKESKKHRQGPSPVKATDEGAVAVEPSRPIRIAVVDPQAELVDVKIVEENVGARPLSEVEAEEAAAKASAEQGKANEERQLNPGVRPTRSREK